MGTKKGDDVVFYRSLDGSVRMRVRRLRKGAGRRSFAWAEAPRSPAEVRDAIAAELAVKHGPAPTRD